jgi:hypothetical protein
MLSPDKIGIAFGLSAWGRHAALNVLQTLPLVPVQVLDGCLKAVIKSAPRTNPLSTPLPQGAVKPCNARGCLPSKNSSHILGLMRIWSRKEKYAKSDNAGVPTLLWDQHWALVLPHVSPALNCLRRLLHHVACIHMLEEFQEYLRESYGPDWRFACIQATKGPFPVSVKRAKGVEGSNLHSELRKDLKAGVDAISRFFNSDWWTWKQGSALLFWRWPAGEQRKFAQDGMPLWIWSRLPRFLDRP